MKNEKEKTSKSTYPMEKIAYIEPADYFPEEIRKKYGLGEYAKKNAEDEIDKWTSSQLYNGVIIWTIQSLF